MEKLFIDFSVNQGKIKDMDAVNNGPSFPNVRTPQRSNFDLYKEAGFSYARNHDASLYQLYGGEHIVDVHRIFKNFDADENDPENYIFEPTDKYLFNTLEAGTKIFYRLGASIEHYYKYGTRVPKNFAKWARICEHIIRHYNEGWANGYNLGIEYWEIWNEPDCKNADGSNPCWQGTEEEFIEMYCVSAKYLKEKFPQLKIGGPAFCMSHLNNFTKNFLSTIKENGAPLDFYSYHCYARELNWFGSVIRDVREYLDRYGFKDTETILNEWNYVRGWRNDDWDYSVYAEQGLKGASFITGAMALGQANPLDMLMYYDARPCKMNGIFTDDFKPRKGYYCYTMFKKLKELGNYVPIKYNGNEIFTCAATSGGKHAIMLTYYDEYAKGIIDTAFKMWKETTDCTFEECYKQAVKQEKESGYANTTYRDVCLEIANITEKSKVSYYCLDDEKNAELVKEEVVPSGKYTLNINVSLFSTWLIEIKSV